jgi:hypothetical protein
MPSDDGLRLDNRHSVQHRRKQAIQPDEEQSVRHRQLRPRGYALTQYTQLVSQQHNLGFQSRLRLEWRDQDVDEQDQERDHRALSLADLAAHASPDEVLGMDSSVFNNLAGSIRGQKRQRDNPRPDAFYGASARRPEGLLTVILSTLRVST